MASTSIYTEQYPHRRKVTRQGNRDTPGRLVLERKPGEDVIDVRGEGRIPIADVREALAEIAKPIPPVDGDDGI